MTTRPAYLDYTADDEFAEGYRRYQERYAREPRESDRITMEIVRRELVRMGRADAGDVLDAGCSTGNLLRHMVRHVPGARLVGGDLMEGHLQQAAADPELGAVEFRRLDLADLALDRAFDVIVANAVIYLFDDDTLADALAGIGRALRPGGALVAFDFVHPFRQELAIHETSETHPEGLTLHMRSRPTLDAALSAAGLGDTEVHPFRIGIDLPVPPDPRDIVTRTVATREGDRLLLRGALLQPWAHIVARRGGR